MKWISFLTSCTVTLAPENSAPCSGGRRGVFHHLLGVEGHDPVFTSSSICCSCLFPLLLPPGVKPPLLLLPLTSPRDVSLLTAAGALEMPRSMRFSAGFGVWACAGTSLGPSLASLLLPRGSGGGEGFLVQAFVSHPSTLVDTDILDVGEENPEAGPGGNF